VGFLVFLGFLKNVRVKMDFDLFLIRRRLWVIFLIFGLSIAGSVLVVQVTPPTFQSNVKIFVSSPTGDSAEALLQGSNFAQQRVASYAEVASSPLVVGRALEKLGLKMNLEEVGSLISASVPRNTVLINLTVTHTDPYFARDLVNAVAESLAFVVSSLELESSLRPQPVKLTVVEPGLLNLDRVAPSLLEHIAIGGFLGLILGLGVAILLELLFRKVRVRTKIEELGINKLLGAIPFAPEGDRGITQLMQDSEKSIASESFLHLRTSVDFSIKNSEKKSIVIASAMHGEGKTYIAVNLAIVLAKAGRKTLLIDSDLRSPSCHKLLDFDGDIGVSQILAGLPDWQKNIQHHGETGLDFIAGGAVPSNPSELLGSRNMKDLLDWAEQNYEVVILDSSPVLAVTDSVILASQASGVVMVVAIDETSVTQVKMALSLLESRGVNVFGAVRNKVKHDRGSIELYGYGYAYGVPKGVSRNGRTLWKWRS
jgi:succinoglycan biosynthesis transport protein ExoP